MKKVLILTYYFPPVNTVAANRAWSWVQHFHKHNLYPTVITRHWTGEEKGWSDFVKDNSSGEVHEQHSHYEVYRFPSDKIALIKYLKNNLLRFRLASKIIYFLVNYFGYLNPEADAYTSFKKKLKAHLQTHQYDLILATSPPLNIIRLASEISKENNIPFFIDFRDLWNNEYLRVNFRQSRIKHFLDKRRLNYLRSWLKDVKMCFAVSQPIADVLGLVNDGPKTIIYNGYDELIFNNVKKEARNIFCISFVGTFYAKQNLDLICEGLKIFLKNKNPEDVKIRLIGVSANQKIVDKLYKAIPAIFIESVDRVSREEAARYVVNSDLLFQAGWEGYRGVFTTKFFDYLASGNNILLAPGDQDVLSTLITETGAGKIADTSDAVIKELNAWYDEWKQEGKLAYFGNDKIAFYSRKNQAEKLVNAIAESMNFESKNTVPEPIKALIVSYYFPPCNGAPSWRPYSWATIFPEYNIHSTIVTRHWTGNENTWDDFIRDDKSPSTYRQYNGYDVYALPSRKSKIVNLFSSKKPWITPFRKFVYLILNTLGHFNTEVDAYITFRDFLKYHLAQKNYDVIIVTSPPPNMARLCKHIKKYSDTKLILDFRDLWNNALLERNYKPDIKQKYFDLLFNLYHKKWLSYPDMFTIVVDPFREILRQHTSTPIETIYNGYEENIFAETKKITSTKFRFSVIGTIYPKQDCSILINGLRNFLIDKSTSEVVINFIGLNSIPEVASEITQTLPREFLNITDRVPKKLAIFHTVNSEVLFYPAWKGVRGIISTKAFDYIASGNKILLAPGDGDVLDKLIMDTKSGEIVNDQISFENTLNRWFSQWKLNGHLEGENDFSKVAEYSRENQAAKFADKIKDLICK